MPIWAVETAPCPSLAFLAAAASAAQPVLAQGPRAQVTYGERGRAGGLQTEQTSDADKFSCELQGVLCLQKDAFSRTAAEIQHQHMACRHCPVLLPHVSCSQYHVTDQHDVCSMCR